MGQGLPQPLPHFAHVRHGNQRNAFLFPLRRELLRRVRCYRDHRRLAGRFPFHNEIEFPHRDQ